MRESYSPDGKKTKKQNIERRWHSSWKHFQLLQSRLRQTFLLFNTFVVKYLFNKIHRFMYLFGFLNAYYCYWNRLLVAFTPDMILKVLCN